MDRESNSRIYKDTLQLPTASPAGTEREREAAEGDGHRICRRKKKKKASLVSAWIIYQVVAAVSGVRYLDTASFFLDRFPRRRNSRSGLERLHVCIVICVVLGGTSRWWGSSRISALGWPCFGLCRV
ncbi:hypothetical protein Taro_040377 [Colocasia esculenta]|uniref:Uncharacterized protein n=1 Tax=Colocasia esculenta TaxID=4460 RepID=A0A843WUE3_COLES|nr:hypothetical protein [Colocasia esculenta]